MGADYRITHRSILGFQGDTNLGAGATDYMGLGGNLGPIPQSEARVPMDCIIDNLHARTQTAPGAGDTFTYTLMVNGIATALTCQIAGAVAQEAEDLVNQIAVQRGDRVCVRIVSTGGAAVCEHSAPCRVTS